MCCDVNSVTAMSTKCNVAMCDVARCEIDSAMNREEQLWLCEIGTKGDGFLTALVQGREIDREWGDPMILSLVRLP